MTDKVINKSKAEEEGETGHILPPYKHEIFETFDEMGVNEKVLRGVYALGFENPSSIQKRAIVPVSLGYDIIAQSQSGTGKTATFTIGCLQRVDPSIKAPQMVVLAPTRELATQNHKVCTDLADYLDIKICLCIGGEPLDENIKELDRGAHVVIGTPGRIYDLMKRWALKTDHLKSVVLDEADEMLTRGFKEQVYDICNYIPPESESYSVQFCLFSATIPDEVLEVTEQFMKESKVRILVKKEELTLEGIKQYFVAVEKEYWKLDTLTDIYTHLTVDQAIIYTNTKRKAIELTDKLRAADFSVVCIHSDMSQHERNRVIRDFKIGTERILIATDIIARGIDVQQVSLVINYDLPKFKETYIHRIGRSGRYGRKGMAINFATSTDLKLIDEYRNFYMTKISEMPHDFTKL